jgi:Protein of unknown function (DUF2997)
MIDKKIHIRISEDGKFYAETFGIKGKDCLSYIELLEELLDAETVDSAFTQEYHETEIQIQHDNKQIIKGEE